MTDDDINRRVAELEGWEYNGTFWQRAGELADIDPPSYTSDWGRCGPLIEKYGLSLRRIERWDEEDQEDDSSWGVYGPRHRPVAEDYSLTRAICEAVIVLASVDK